MRTYAKLLILGLLILTLNGCTPLGYCEADGRYYYIDDYGVEQSVLQSDPGGARYCPAPVPEEPMPIVVDQMWLLVNDEDGNWCVLIAASHPSVPSQKAKCFPGQDWVATNAMCSASVFDDGTDYGYWPCDGPLEEWRIQTNGHATGAGRVDLEQLVKINERHQALFEDGSPD